MTELSRADHSSHPPCVHFPRRFNAAHDLIERNLQAGRAAKIAYIDDAGQTTFGALAEQVNRAANALVGQGLRMEERVMLVHQDSVAWVAAFLGAIKAGIVPLATNTLFTPNDYQALLQESRAQAILVSAELLPALLPAIKASPFLRRVLVSGRATDEGLHWQTLLATASTAFAPAATCCDDTAFWLFSSGSTGTPKGTLHLHSSMMHTAELYARAVLGMRESDIVFSAAKLFFAYGLGNALSFPLAVGATTVLMAERPTPQAVFARLKQHQATVFFGVPTLIAGLLASAELPSPSETALRVAVSAGEALPAELGQRWQRHFGLDLLDGIGSTEMLHIFISNEPGQVRYGTSGQPVPGYRMRLVNDGGAEAALGEVADLYISGPTAASGYWNNRDKTRATFQGEWVRSGDKYSRDADGYYTYAGRSDDMMKVSGMYVSPFEVEGVLMTHATVLEAAVVGQEDQDRLLKPKAFIVLKEGQSGSSALATELQQLVRARLAPHKYPRWIEFVAALPKTATGKIQRFKLRGA
ncbi:MAG: benzoate-CoA ligase family protein [Betaproteobacteria bacterium]|nr:benzoate-CoA ligase family protein [Betaproteobacteria bacterium]